MSPRARPKPPLTASRGVEELVLLWRLPGGRWHLRREGEEVEQVWVSLTEMVRYDLPEADYADAKRTVLMPGSIAGGPL